VRHRSGVRVRRVIFVGVEGKSDGALVQFLQRVSDDLRLHLHLDVKQGSGGDSLQVVDQARRRLERHPARRMLKARLVLLDADRIEQDRKAGRDASAGSGLPGPYRDRFRGALPGARIPWGIIPLT